VHVLPHITVVIIAGDLHCVSQIVQVNHFCVRVVVVVVVTIIITVVGVAVVGSQTLTSWYAAVR
jgi:hypothetical protein